MTGQPEVKAVLFHFHESLISADQWMAMETRGIALEIMAALSTMGLAPGAPMRWLTGSPCCRT